jgi:hypothetical protein
VLLLQQLLLHLLLLAQPPQRQVQLVLLLLQQVLLLLLQHPLMQGRFTSRTGAQAFDQLDSCSNARYYLSRSSTTATGLQWVLLA